MNRFLCICDNSPLSIYNLLGPECKASACNVGGSGSIPGSGRSLEKEMATHSGTLACKIPGMEKPVVYSLW